MGASRQNAVFYAPPNFGLQQSLHQGDQKRRRSAVTLVGRHPPQNRKGEVNDTAECTRKIRIKEGEVQETPNAYWKLESV